MDYMRIGVAHGGPSTRESRLAQLRMILFCGMCFVLPMKASFVYSFSLLLLLVFLFEGQLGKKFAAIRSSPLCLAMVAYCVVVLLSMLWSENIQDGWRMVRRQIPLLLFLLYWTSAEARFRERYLTAFLAGLLVCAVLAHYNWLQLYFFPDWPRGIRVDKTPFDTAPFVDRIMYAPALALGSYLALRRLLGAPGLRGRLVWLVFSAALISNLLFSGGRAGMVMFAAMCVALIFERVRARGKALVVSMLLLPLVLWGAYQSSDYFAQRVNEAVHDFRIFEDNPNSSVGLRIVYGVTSFKIFLEHPWIGVGAGDFEEQYAHSKPRQWSNTEDPFNPHNQYLLTAATTGLLGLTALLAIFVTAVRSRRDARTIALLLGYGVVFLFESYLWRSNTALIFSSMLAVLVLGRNEAMPPTRPAAPA